jgi:hypothetical protein
MSSCLGIAVANHLTELDKSGPSSDGAKEKLLKEEQSKFIYATDLQKSFDTAWVLWEAVSKFLP